MTAESGRAGRDHGGNLDAARARWGGAPGADGVDPWIDLSTGINRVPYPMPALTPHALTALPTAADQRALIEAARLAWGVSGDLLALSGAQAAIQLVPRLTAPGRGPGRGPGRAAVLGPTYNEHAASLAAQGWEVAQVGRLADLGGADLAVVVNPNNPDGAVHDPEALAALLPRVGRLIVDESFADPTPAMSLLPRSGAEGLVVLRSFGKFYGLAGLRLGFAAGGPRTIARLAELAGPWAVSGPAIAAGRAALADRAWAAATTARLVADAARADALARGAGWAVAGGTTLFRLYETQDAAAAQDRLARHRIWSRIFPWHPRWLRLGLPGTAAEWARLAEALS